MKQLSSDKAAVDLYIVKFCTRYASPIFFIFMQLRGKWSNNRLASPLWGWRQLGNLTMMACDSSTLLVQGRVNKKKVRNQVFSLIVWLTVNGVPCRAWTCI